MHFKSSLSLMQFFLERNENWSINNINFQWKQAYSFICCRTVSWFCSMRFKDSCSPRRRCSKAWFSWIRCINWVCMKFHQGCSWWPHFPLETIRTAFIFFLLKKAFYKKRYTSKMLSSTFYQNICRCHFDYQMSQECFFHEEKIQII